MRGQAEFGRRPWSTTGDPVAELDLNPVLAGPSGCIAVDVKLRLSAVGDEPDPYLRNLLAGRVAHRGAPGT